MPELAIGAAPLAPVCSCIIGSSTATVSTFRYVKLPLTNKLPFTVALPLKLASVPFTAARVAVPLTDNELNVPTEVIFGCAAVYTVPDTSAFAT